MPPERLNGLDAQLQATAQPKVAEATRVNAGRLSNLDWNAPLAAGCGALSGCRSELSALGDWCALMKAELPARRGASP